MRYRKPGVPQMGNGMRRFLLGLAVVLVVAGAGIGSYAFARRDAVANRKRAEQLQTELAQVQDQLRSAARQNDYLAEQARQGAVALSSAGRDSQSRQARLRAAQQKTQGALARSKAKLRGLSSGLSGSVGTVHYTPPAKKGAAGSVEGTVTISNSAGIPLTAVCVVDAGGVAYAVTSRGIPAGGSATESFRFAYAGPAPAGVSAGGCGRL